MFNKYKEILSLHFIKSATLEFGNNIFKETNKLWEGYIKYSTILAKQAFSYLVTLPPFRTDTSYPVGSTAI